MAADAAHTERSHIAGRSSLQLGPRYPRLPDSSHIPPHSAPPGTVGIQIFACHSWYSGSRPLAHRPGKSCGHRERVEIDQKGHDTWDKCALPPWSPQQLQMYFKNVNKLNVRFYYFFIFDQNSEVCIYQPAQHSYTDSINTFWMVIYIFFYLFYTILLMSAPKIASKSIYTQCIKYA